MNERPAIGATLPKRNFFIRTVHIFAQVGLKLLKPFTKKITYVEIICALLIVLYLYTGLSKIMENDKFRYEMGRSPFIENFSNFIGVTLPLGEILLALALIIKRTRLISLYLSYFLMLLFTGYIWLMLNYSPDLPCSCGGIISKMSWNDHLIFNACFTLLTMGGVILQSQLIQNKARNLPIPV